MKRKIVSLLTMGVLAISLIGCGNAQENTTAPATQENNTVSEVTTDDETPEATEEVIEEETATDAMKGFGDVAIGEYVTFGHYEQDKDYSDGRGNDPIEWIVLDHQDGRTLLVSRNILAAEKYNDEWVEVTWEDCTLRAWMNGEFYDEAFTDEEKSIIALTHNENPDPADDIWEAYVYGQPCETVGGNDTDDYVFCLSTQEAVKYFGATVYDNQTRNDVINNGGTTQDLYDAIQPTVLDEWALAFVPEELKYNLGSGYRYNEYDRVPEYYTGSHEYWLRSSGPKYQNEAAVTGFEINSCTVSNVNGVRPAIWVND